MQVARNYFLQAEPNRLGYVEIKMQPAIGDILISEITTDTHYGDLYLVSGKNECSLIGNVKGADVYLLRRFGSRYFSWHSGLENYVICIQDSTGMRVNNAKVVDDPTLLFEINLQLATHGVEL